MAHDSSLVKVCRQCVDKAVNTLSAYADMDKCNLCLQLVLQFLYDISYALVGLVYIIHYATAYA